MKLFTFFLFIATLQLSAKSYSQKINLSGSDITLKQAFRQIEKQTGYSFFVNHKLLREEKPVSFSLQNATIGEAMQTLLKGKPLSYVIIDKTVILKEKEDTPLKEDPEILLPSQPIEGVIRDSATGDPLAGVTIRVKGTTTGAVTDGSGRFSLEAEDDAVLDVSFVGYSPQDVAVNGRSSIEVLLSSSATGLDQLVVVGYGTQKKQDVTSSISAVSGDEIRETPTANLQNGLNGKLPGLFSQQRSGRPGAESAAKIYVRGVSTFTGSTTPLVLVDDIEYPYDQLFLIDPEEVESISILKDAAATAVYGIKGANGVLLVTTRRGKEGKATIKLRTQWGIQSPTHILKTLDAYHSALLQNEADKNDGNNPMFTLEDLAYFKSGKDPYGHPNVDWYNTLFKKSTHVTNNNLNISGGGKRVKYFVTLGYQFQNGLVKDVPYMGGDEAASGKTRLNGNFFAKRYKFRSNLDIDVTNTLNFQVDLTGTKLHTNRPKAEFLFGQIFRYDNNNPFIMPVYNPDGSFGWGNPNWMVPPAANNNIAATYSLGGYTRAQNNFMNVHISARQNLDDLLQGLTVGANVAYSFGNTGERTLTRYAVQIPTYWYDPQEDKYTPKDPNVFSIPPYTLEYSAGTPNRQLNLRGNVNYDRSFGDHNVGALALFSQTSYYLGANPPSNFRGYTFRFSYNYKHKYLFQVSGAYNGTDRFITQKRYTLFPALSVGWNIAKEEFFNTVFPTIESFKLRGSYGWVGSDDIGGNQYLYEEIYDRSGSYSFGEFHNGLNTIVEGTLGNKNVSWQTERKANLGLDYSILSGKISGSIDVFDNFRYDILTFRRTVPSYFGIDASNLPPVNIGKVGNKGMEFEVDYRDQFGLVGINIKANVSFAKNKIIFQDEPEPKYPWQQATGRSIGMTRQWEWLGFYKDQDDIDNSANPAGVINPGYLKYKDLNEDGKVDGDDRAYVGYPNLPNTNLGLNLGATFKGFSLSVLLQSALNFDVFLGNGNAVPFKTDLQPIHQGRWTPETADNATFPTLTTTFNGTYMNPDNRSTFWTTRGDYLRIRSMNLSYRIASSLVQKLGIANASVFANGYDLFTWSKFMKRWQFDPEIDNASSGYIYPTERIINFGLDITF